MVVVLLLSIIMALSIPGYRQYVQRANRTDATSDLLRLAAGQERFYLQNGTYATNAQLAAAPPAGLGFTGGKTQRGYYNVAITVANATRFTATARMYLRLYNPQGTTKISRSTSGRFRRISYFTRGNRNIETSEQLLRLILMQIHCYAFLT